MTLESHLAPVPTRPDLPDWYLAQLHPVYPFRTCRCTRCGEEQPDAGQIPDGEKTGTCMICGKFWSLELVWPVPDFGKGEEA